MRSLLGDIARLWLALTVLNAVGVLLVGIWLDFDPATMPGVLVLAGVVELVVTLRVLRVGRRIVRIFFW